MRLAVVLAAVCILTPSRVFAQETKAPDEPRTLGGYTFNYPATIDSAFIDTYFGTRTGGRFETVSDVPLGPATFTVQGLGVRENIDFQGRLGERWALRVALLGQFTTGTSGKALATLGSTYSYGASLGVAFRILRSESTGTQLTARLDAIGINGGGRLTLGPLARELRNEPLRSIPDVVANFGDLITEPSSSWGAGASINIAQALSPMFSIQGSFRLDLRRFQRSPYTVSVGRVDINETGWVPQGGVALGFDPLVIPLAFLAEYRLSAQNDNDPTASANNVLALGTYYSGRRDLELGLTLAAELGLPPIQGLDANGFPSSSSKGTAFSMAMVMRYFW
ncbi:MAG TPA: hypothetical protein VJT73_02205 [Polyangiaceae bacterium]|nr:hypothetical protein [Polyangiaceae bacterium]